MPHVCTPRANALMVSAVSQPESQPASHLVNQSALNISHGLIICIHVIIYDPEALSDESIPTFFEILVQGVRALNDRVQPWAMTGQAARASGSGCSSAAAKAEPSEGELASLHSMLGCPIWAPIPPDTLLYYVSRIK